MKDGTNGWNDYVNLIQKWERKSTVFEEFEKIFSISFFALETE